MSALESISQESPANSQVSFDVYPLKPARGHIKGALGLHEQAKNLGESILAEINGSTDEQVKNSNILGRIVLKSLFTNARPETVANPSLTIMVADFPESDDLRHILFTERRFNKQGKLIIKRGVIVERSKDALGYADNVNTHEIDELGMISLGIMEAVNRSLSYNQNDKPQIRDEITAVLRAAKSSLDGNLNSAGKLIEAKRLAKP